MKMGMLKYSNTSYNMLFVAIPFTGTPFTNMDLR